MQSVNIVLPEALEVFVSERVKSGGYGDMTAYICDLIRTDREQKAEREIEAEIAKGLASGPPELVTDETWAALRAPYVQPK